MTAETVPEQRTSTRRRWWPIVAGLLVAAVVGVTVTVLVVGDDEPATVRVTFEASGPGAAPLSVVWRTPDERSPADDRKPALPWSRTMETSAPEGPLFLQVNGKLTDARATGPYTCRILVDGRVVVQDGPSAVPHCWTTLQRVFAGTAP